MDKKSKIENWGAKELKAGGRTFKKLKDFFAGIGLAFTTAVFVLGFSILILWGFYFLRQLIENRIDSNVEFSLDLTKKSELPTQFAGSPNGQSAAMESPCLPGSGATINCSTQVNASSSANSSDNLIYAGYTDLFSGVGGLSQSETTMYRDDIVTAMMFPPSLVWTEKSEGIAPPDFSSACVSGSCLSAKGTVLTLNGSPIKLPIAGDIHNITADVIGSGWAVGIVLKETGDLSTQAGYAGYAYRFDGKNFTPIFSGKAFDSQYEGKWGFGGTADDFLAVYGAYQGKGYRIRGNNITDISQFFDVRVMKGGIRPGIVRAGNDVHATWYLFNKEKNNRVVFVKLFQNGTADIVGEADVLGTAPVSFSYLAVTSVSGSFPFLISAYIEKAGSSYIWNAVDNGFIIPSAPVAVTSVNLNNYVNTEVPHLIGLTSKDFSAGDANISFEVRNTDSGKWEAVSLGSSHWFSDPRGAALEWRMRVVPGANSEFTPFLGQLLVEYKVKRF